MNERWTGVVVGKMHIYGISQSEIAAEMGVTRAYVSMVLNGIKKPKNSRQRIENALDTLIKRRKEEQIETVNE